MPFYTWPTYLNLCISGLIFLLTTGLSVYLWFKRRVSGASYFFVLSVFGALCSIFYFLEETSRFLNNKILWENLQFTSFSLIGIFFTAFVLVFTGRMPRIRRNFWLLMSIEPLINLVVIWTGRSHPLFRILPFIQNGGFNYPGVLVYQFGLWYWINILYTLLIFFGNIMLMIWQYLHLPQWARNSLWYLIIGTLLPCITLVLTFKDNGGGKYDTVFIISTMIGVALIAWGVLHSHIMSILPIAREALLDQLSDGVVLVNLDYQIVEMNQTARRYVTAPVSRWINQPFLHVFPEFSQATFSLENSEPQELEVSLNLRGQVEIFDARISSLWNDSKEIVGWMVIFHNISSRKKVENQLREAELLAEKALSNVQIHSKELSILRGAAEKLNQATTLRGALIPTLATIQKASAPESLWLLQITSSDSTTYRRISYTPEEPDSPLKFSENTDAPTPYLRDLIDGTLVNSRHYRVSGQEDHLHIAFALKSGQVPVGVLVGQYGAENLPNENTIHLMETLCDSLSVAMDRAALLKSQYHQRRLEAAYRDVNVRLSASLNLDEVFDLLLEQITRILPVNGSSIFHIEKNNAEIIRSRGYDLLPEEELHSIANFSFPINNNDFMRQIIDKKRPVVIEDTQKEPGWYQTAVSRHFRSWIGVPLVIEGRVEYLFSLDHRAPGFFTQENADQLTAFCSEASLAIQNAQLFNTSQKRLREFESLHDTLSEISAQLDLNTLLNDIINRALILLNSTSVVLGLYEKETESYKVAVTNITLEGFSGYLPRQRSVINSLVGSREIKAVNDYSNWPERIEELVPAFPHAVVEVPLQAGDELLGILVIGDSHAGRIYNVEDIRLISLFAQQATIALSNARLFSNARQRAEEAETLRHANAIIASTLDQKEVLRLILEQLSSVIPYDSASIFLKQDKELVMVEGRRLRNKDNPLGIRISLNEAQPGVLVWKEKQTLVINDMELEFPNFLKLNTSGIRSWIGVPLIIKDKAIGVMALDSLQPNRYTENHARLASAFANQVAIAMDNVRLYEDAIKSTKRLTTLYKLGQRITANLQPEEVYRAIHKATRDLMASDSFILSLYNEENQTVDDVYFTDHGILQKNTSTPIGEGLFSRAITENRSLMYNSFSEQMSKRTNALIVGDDRDDTLVQSLIIVPMRIAHKIKGVISTQSYQRNAFTDDDRETLELLASQSAIVLENARLFSEIQDMAMTDALTRIYNRRKFFEMADLEFERSRRYQRPLSIVMMDIDHFKHVNDTYGHAAGDVILTRVAEICRNALRSVDILARHGGDEFVVMLPETTDSEAQLTAERMRQLVARTPIQVGENSVKITLSFGVVELESSCKSIEELLDRSDQAMYASKHRGRNQVSVWPKDL